MRKAGGYGFYTTVEGNVVDEHDTFTCAHCNSVVKVEPFQRPEDLGGQCTLCNAPICPKCADLGVCFPFEKRLEESEAKQEALRSYGLAS